ncbi:hypothetical protein BDZ45DRAFT_692426 [Acephala macrosclerotiorum]|nr:hypothetical protein BDZ45DRAFT_692426 [Acephala macrosclerotiorum]
MAVGSTFRKFVELPVELRLMSWEYTPEPQNLQLNFLSDDLRMSGDSSRDYAVPTVFQVHESRDTTDRRSGVNTLDRFNSLETVFILERGSTNFPLTAYLRDIKVEVVENPGLMIESFARQVKKKSSGWMAPNVRVLDLDKIMGSAERWREALE